MIFNYFNMSSLKLFCELNNIKFRVRETPFVEIEEIEFDDLSNNRHLYFDIDVSKFCCDEEVEHYLINGLKKTFALNNRVTIKRDSLDALLYAKHYLEEKEKNTMPPKSFYGTFTGDLYIKPSFTIPKIKKVIFNDPVTVVIWENGTKTIVRAENEAFDPEKGLAMAICKKALGTNKSESNYYDIFKKWLPKEE